ncbi:class 1 fructose-bisphosphatase [Helicobacter burdigaliensis]|uniref:class 1 fructose-bisphosphatase n=1 Tax=Helicobacter burdigaliensis TaxID=2315334 RepID=UPI000EF68A14|nr:class 1 fructose-bisphosphatase [Helicobacter burdigaliensis]
MIEQELEEILSAFKRATLPIYEVLKASMGEYATSKNQTGDLQLEADISADLILQEIFKEVKCVKQICSEEQENAIELHKEGIYSIAYDPLDGSSLMGANLSVGSIFGIYKGDFLPQNLVGAAYVVYGMVIGLGFASVLKGGVDYYVFNGKEFALQKTLMLKEKGKLNATGGTQANWSESHRKLIQSLFDKGYRLRYSGGMVPDLHHILVKGGGLFSYPSTQDAKKGKLRKLFEVFPFAFIYERAGGEAIDGKKRLLELEVEHLHDTTPCFFGSKEEIEYVRNH